MHRQLWFFSRKPVLLAGLLALALSLIFALHPPLAHAAGTIYYINNLAGSNCSNSGAGTSPSQPWCDFTTANSTTFQPGDQILLARGATWTQALNLHGSGTSWSPGSFITVDAYGSGATPIIRGTSQTTDRGILMTSNPNYWSINNLEIAYVGNGVGVSYSTLGNQGLRFNHLYIHDVNGATLSVGAVDSTPMPAANQWVIKDIQVANVEMANFTYGFIFQIVPSNSPSYPYTNFPPSSIQQVLIQNCYIHNAAKPALVFEPASNITVMDNRFDFSGHVYEPQGTTGGFFYATSNIAMINNTLENMNNTNSTDQSGVDPEGYVDHTTFRGNYIANNAGAGIEFLALSNRAGDYSTNQEVSDNTFANNGTAGNTSFQSSLLFINQTSENMTGSAFNNLYAEPTGFTTGASSTNWTFTNNLSISSSANLFNGGNDFSGVQGQGNWSYRSYDGTTYSNLSYDATNQWWGSASANISRFDEYPGACASCWVARTWTAPSTGTISIRGRVLKNDTSGGDGVLARITRNGTQIWPVSGGPQSIGATDQSGVATELDGINVNAGDAIGFEVNAGGSGDNTGDTTSWSPSIGYTTSSSGGGIVSGKTYKIVNVRSGNVLHEAADLNSGWRSVGTYPWNGANYQQWIITDLGNGYYKLSSVATGSVLHEAGNLNNGWSSVGTYSWYGGVEQQWSFVDLGGGVYKIVSRQTGNVLHEADDLNSGWRTVGTYPWTGSNYQEWTLTPLN